jgi:hypothetical protein
LVARLGANRFDLSTTGFLHPTPAHRARTTSSASRRASSVPRADQRAWIADAHPARSIEYTLLIGRTRPSDSYPALAFRSVAPGVRVAVAVASALFSVGGSSAGVGGTRSLHNRATRSGSITGARGRCRPAGACGARARGAIYPASATASAVASAVATARGGKVLGQVSRGSCPTGTIEHWPREVGRLHAMHTLEHGPWQQTASTQLPLPHCSFAVQV